MRWNHKIKGLRSVMTEETDAESVLKSCNAIADILEPLKFLQDFDYLYDLRGCDDLLEANGILESFWDYCDDHRIWVDLSTTDCKAAARSS